jgi:hypothetical protein
MRLSGIIFVTLFFLVSVSDPSLAQKEKTPWYRSQQIRLLKSKLAVIEKSQKEIVNLNWQVEASVHQVKVFAHKGPRRKKKK